MNQDPRYISKSQQVEVSAEALYAKLKHRLMEKLYEEGYTNDDGVYVDPLPARDLSTIAGVVLKMVKHESEIKKAQDVKVTVVPIPALPPIRK